jgi:hypothetical protein
MADLFSPDRSVAACLAHVDSPIACLTGLSAQLDRNRYQPSSVIAFLSHELAPPNHGADTLGSSIECEGGLGQSH